MASIYPHSWCVFSVVGSKGFCRIQDSLIATIAIIPTTNYNDYTTTLALSSRNKQLYINLDL